MGGGGLSATSNLDLRQNLEIWIFHGGRGGGVICKCDGKRKKPK